jgi:hypothetical protein
MKRNPFCRQYSECLTRAARGDSDLTCSGCPRRFEHCEIPFFEIEPAILLNWAIFHPERWGRYNKMKKMKPWL